MYTPEELIFTDVLSSFNSFWDLAGIVAMDPKYGDFDKWQLTCKDGLRGMLARISAVDREYQAAYSCNSNGALYKNPNEFGTDCESHIGLAFFAMDSTIECLVFALNAFGYAKSKSDFLDITDEKSLRLIAPKNIMGPPPGKTDRDNPRSGYLKYYPRTTAYFKAQENLLYCLFEYHDVSKHRSCISVGMHLREAPKLPGSVMSSTDFTFDSLAIGFQQFICTVLPIALEETAQMFGRTIYKHDKLALHNIRVKRFSRSGRTR